MATLQRKARPARIASYCLSIYRKANYRVVICRGRQILGVAGSHMDIIEADAMARSFNRIAYRKPEFAIICPMAKRIPDVRYPKGGA